MKNLSLFLLFILSLAIQPINARVIQGRVFSAVDTTVVEGRIAG